METEGHFDVAVIGGGVAGLSSAIMLARKGKSVALFEKNAYPMHRVCGEYVSMESWDFLKALDFPLDEMELPKISKLRITLPSGEQLKSKLDLGGFGISRYTLDYELANIAQANGVDMWEKTTVGSISFKDDQHIINTSQGIFTAKVVIGSFGKRSGLDKKLNRPFINKKVSPSQNYIGIKYHIKGEVPDDQVELHIFKDGYCGISKTDEGRYCLCYLTTAENLQKHKGDIKAMEYYLLSENPFLKKYFSDLISYFSSPSVISQISFDKKDVIEDHILTEGDAAGLISPLCGNGISMAFNASYILAPLVNDYLDGKITRSQLESTYRNKWKKKFSKRLTAARIIQHLFFKPRLLSLLMKVCNAFPVLTKKLIRLTHGKPFYISKGLRNVHFSAGAQ